MAFLRSLTTASILPSAALAFVSSSSSSSSQPSKPHFPILPFSSFPSKPRPDRSSSPLVRNFTPLHSALHMDSLATTEQKNEVLPELLTEFMVDMKCDGCVSAVKNKLQTIDGVKGVDVDLTNQVVRVLGSLPVKTMVDALEQTGRKTRLIGQGIPEAFLVSAAVAEFKGPVIFGVVRLAQVNMELARVEASFSGLSPGKHGWTINEFGDLTKGAASTGKVFNPNNQAALEEPLGDLGTLDAQESGEAFFSGSKKMLRVADLIGRSIVVYETEDKSDTGIAAAVIARSAGVGENYKKICTCDGVTIWESSNNDFATSKA
ncbi:copper chaperone for superoxide dismutase, chloroplastic isoform X2 [Magnolia sinica]|uniref:copper chaperone for superoxide dismutase, chloroplastic isoform X2 n=1 Tax=Magnolia sinica TaxID=86752 RepID=UPI00265B1298|nr:copper chaperone for superoxide dismutase, chloroplastic isoform X2 [Magnolia sinica]